MAQRKLRMAVIKPLTPKTKPAVTQVPKYSPPKTPSTTPGSVPGFKAAPGRPETNVGQYLLRKTDESKTGNELLNTTPMAIEQVQQQYLHNGELPKALQPKYLRKPEVMEVARRKAISDGFKNPRKQV